MSAALIRSPLWKTAEHAFLTVKNNDPGRRMAALLTGGSSIWLNRLLWTIR